MATTQRSAAAVAPALAFKNVVAVRPNARAARPQQQQSQALKQRQAVRVAAGEALDHRPLARIARSAAIGAAAAGLGTAGAAGVPPHSALPAPGGPTPYASAPPPPPAAVAAPVANGSAPSSVGSAAKPMDIVSCGGRPPGQTRGVDAGLTFGPCPAASVCAHFGWVRQPVLFCHSIPASCDPQVFVSAEVAPWR